MTSICNVSENCRAKLDSGRSMLKHIRFFHSAEIVGNKQFSCFVVGCHVIVSSFKNLGKHISICPFLQSEPPLNDSGENLNENEAGHETNHLPIQGEMVVDIQSPSNTEIRNSILTEDQLETLLDKNVHSFIGSLVSAGIPSSRINCIVKGFEEINEAVLVEMLTVIESSVDMNRKAEILAKQIAILRNGFRMVSSTYLRKKNIESMPLPEEIFLYSRKDLRLDSNTQTYKETKVPCTFQYVSIIDSLKTLLSFESLREYILKSELKSSCDGIIQDITDGTLWENSPPCSDNVKFLRIQIYFDEFEVVNPIGNRTASHKIGAMYFILRNLSSFQNSKLSNIFLLSLFYSVDIAEVGYNPVLEPFVRDMKILETEGFTIDSVKNITFKATVVAMSYDNLGANAISGLVESFTAGSYFCRFCLLNKDELQITFREVQDKLRNSENYSNHLKQAIESGTIVFGVKRPCLLNSLTYFKFPEYHSVDLLHDILEGVLPYEIKLFLNTLVNEKKKITMINLNNRARFFNYGSIEIRNRPSVINLEKPSKTNINQKGGQMWCLGRFLPLIIGDLIDDEDLLRKWELHILLLRIMLIIFSFKVTSGLIDQLEMLIEDFLQLFTELYPNEKIIPKMHFLIHYPSVMRRLGPLSQLSSIRFEGNHLLFKRIAKYCQNFINVIQTLANRYQQSKASKLKENGIVECTLDHGKGICLPISQFEFRTVVLEFLGVPESEYITVVKRLNYLQEYRVGYLLCTGINDHSNLPIFGQIKKLFIYESVPFAVVQKYQTNFFNEHYFSYEVSASNNVDLEVIDLKNLFCVTPFEIHYNLDEKDDTKFIVPKTFIF